MKRRLLLFALAFFAIVLIVYVFHFEERRSHDGETSAATSASPSEKSPPVAATAVSHANTDSPSTRSSASTKPAPSAVSAGPANAPTTEAAALGYLQSASKRSWDLKRDDFSNQIRTLSGGDLESETVLPREAADQFVKFYSQGLFGVDPARVSFNREEVTDRTRLIYGQVVDGTPVYGGSLTLFFENGALTRVQNDLAPYDIDSGSTPRPLSEAFSSYKAAQASLYDVSLQDHPSNREVLLSNGRALVYAYEFVTKESEKGSNEPAKTYRVLYNAADSFVIQRRSSAVR